MNTSGTEMPNPSTEWKEDIDPFEEEKFKNYTMKLVLIQKVKNKEYGKGRLLHRKQLMALNAKLKIRDNIPEYCKHGVFISGREYACNIRLSNGGLDNKPDKSPDIRGFAVKIRDINGKSAITGNTQNEQDFLFINHTTFSSAKANEFLDILMHLSQGPSELLKFMIKTYGFFGMIGKFKKIYGVINKPFSGFATENFSTVVPLQCGPYAMKIHLVPIARDVNKNALKNLAADMSSRIALGEVRYELALQFFINEEDTPIEDGSKEWNTTISPLVPVADLVISATENPGDTQARVNEETERMAFDPWNAITQHRPLGNIMRARKPTYYASQHNRKIRN